VLEESNGGAAGRAVNPVDRALVIFASHLFNVAEMREAHPIRATVPFNSRLKWMATIHDIPKGDGDACNGNDDGNKSSKIKGAVDGTTLLIIKGAPEYMLQRASKILLPDGSEVPKTQKLEIIVNQVFENTVMTDISFSQICFSEMAQRVRLALFALSVTTPR
jgi:magnesium-transporting ATPase (P-type)